jgi:conjugal transfer pilus assembly protein TrbC
MALLCAVSAYAADPKLEQALKAGDQAVRQYQPHPLFSAPNPTAGEAQRKAFEQSLKTQANAAAANAAAPITLTIAISLSMPKGSLERLAASAEQVNAQLVLRGLTDESLPKTAARMQSLLEKYPKLGINIDPTVFQAHAITKVPTFVLSRDAATGTCNGSCADAARTSIVAGDVTLKYALDYLARSERDTELAGFARRTAESLKE